MVLKIKVDGFSYLFKSKLSTQTNLIKNTKQIHQTTLVYKLFRLIYSTYKKNMIMTHSKFSDNKIYNRKFDAYPHVLMSFTLIRSDLHKNKKEMI